MNTERSTTLSDLPLDVVRLILDLVVTSRQDIGICRKVCTQWKCIIEESNSIWQRMAKHDNIPIYQSEGAQKALTRFWNQRLSATKRLLKELRDLEKDPVEDCSAGPLTDDIFHWTASLLGTKGTPYEEGVFFLDIIYKPSYPFKPPTVRFTTMIYHPNINNNGTHCIGMFYEEWSPAFNIRTILREMRSLFSEFDCDNPMVPSIAQICKTDRELFNKTAKEWTRKFAT